MQIKTGRLLVLLTIPLIVVGAPLAVLMPPDGVMFVYRNYVFVIGLFLSIPLTLLVALVLRWVATGHLRQILWIKQPSVSVRLERAAAAAETAVLLRQRLAACGFAVKEEAGPAGEAVFDFVKPKAPRTYSFIDHGFRGTISLAGADARTEAAVTLTFDDVVLIESGEYDRLRALARYLVGLEAGLTARQAPLTLLNGATLAMANLLILILGLLDHPAWVPPTFSTSLAAAALCVWGLVVVLKDREHLEGLGLGAAGLAAAVVPFLMLF